MPLLALLFVPLLFGLKLLYPWADLGHGTHDSVLAGQANYLNVPWFEARAAIYFVIWISLALITSRMTVNADAAKQPRRQRMLARIGGIGMVLWGLSVTFAAIDWSMSLEPHWFSSIYGVLFMSGQAVSGLSVSVLVSVFMMGASPPSNTINRNRLHDLGNLLLAFVMFWSYVSWMQFLIVWSANLPEETPWYIRRSHGGWQYVVVLLMGFHFLIPFLLLLARQVKRNLRYMVGIGAWLLLMRFVDLSWFVLPAFSERLFLPWPLVFTLPAVGGLWLATFAWQLSVRVPLPVYEVELEEVHDEIATGY